MMFLGEGGLNDVNQNLRGLESDVEEYTDVSRLKGVASDAKIMAEVLEGLVARYRAVETEANAKCKDAEKLSQPPAFEGVKGYDAKKAREEIARKIIEKK
jgi:hypothetical protein